MIGRETNGLAGRCGLDLKVGFVQPQVNRNPSLQKSGNEIHAEVMWLLRVLSKNCSETDKFDYIISNLDISF